MQRKAVFTVTVCLLGLLLVLPRLGMAQQSTSQYVVMKWSFKSTYPYTVHLQLHGQYNKYVWPAPNKYYVLDDSQVHDVSIKCWEGEKICYGAISGKQYWGVGRNDSHGCTDCCAVCASTSVRTKVLTQ